MNSIKKNIPFPSLVTSLYAAWQEYSIPAIFYHYFLSILSKKQKKEQIQLMNRQITLLKNSSHPYHIIANAIEAREKSLEIISKNISQLTKQDSTNSLDWTNQKNQVQTSGFSVLYQSRGTQRADNRNLVQLINHIRMFQKITYEITANVWKWSEELYKLGYQGPIQYLYHHQDYLQKMIKDTKPLTKEYSQMFEDNPFIIIKKEHQHSEYALIYQSVKISPQFARKIEDALQILSNHDSMMERNRILGRFNLIGNRKQIAKSQKLHQIYANYNNGRDYLLVKDSSLKSDKMLVDLQNKHKFLKNRNIIFNPSEPSKNYIEKRHRVHLQQLQKSQYFGQKPYELARHSSLSRIKIKQISHKKAIVMNQQTEEEQNKGKLLQKKLSVYDNLDKTIKYLNGKKKILPEVQIEEADQVRQKTPQIIQTYKTHEIANNKIQFVYEWNISSYEIIKYLKDSVFKEKSIPLTDIETMSKLIIAEKERITIVKAIVGEVVAAWMVIKFLSKDITIRKAVDIILIYKFIKIANLQNAIEEQFVKKGYGIIKERGRIVHQADIVEKTSHKLVKVKYKVAAMLDRKDVKEIVKKHQHLKNSRILKYHYYSKQSKYHQFCDHSDKSCEISFQFQEIFKISVQGKNYFKARCDRILKDKNCYRIQHHINDTELLCAKTLNQIEQFTIKDQIQVNSSFQSQSSDFAYVCFPQNKIAHKYVNSEEKTIIAEFLSIYSDIPELISVAVDKKNLKKECLFFQKPFVLAMICTEKEGYGKTLAVLSFD